MDEFAFDFVRVPGPSPSELAGAGAKGVLVYSFGGRQSDDYLNECRRLGLKIVWIWEREVDSMLNGFDYAVAECQVHERSAQPGELTYVACDLNNGALAGRDLIPFLQGWAATTREPAFGLYGPQDAIAQGQRAGISKLTRWWGVVNWITGGGPDNTPENISFWRGTGAHIVQLIGSPIADTDQNLIMHDDWCTTGPSDQEDDDVKAIYIAKKSDPKAGIWVTDGVWRRHVLSTEWKFVNDLSALGGQPAPPVIEIADEWWNSIPVAGA